VGKSDRLGEGREGLGSNHFCRCVRQALATSLAAGRARGGKRGRHPRIVVACLSSSLLRCNVTVGLGLWAVVDNLLIRGWASCRRSLGLLVRSYVSDSDGATLLGVGLMKSAV
jgi:hypothetical protein